MRLMVNDRIPAHAAKPALVKTSSNLIPTSFQPHSKLIPTSLQRHPPSPTYQGVTCFRRRSLAMLTRWQRFIWLIWPGSSLR